jgi:hypothetical protein
LDARAFAADYRRVNFADLARAMLADRSDYVLAAADRFGLSELIVEKDFWVVWMLGRLFALLSPTLGPFTFKGGTSLSKAFHAIRRFSEDIDISIDRASLGFDDDAHFYNAVSKKETKRRVEEIRNRIHTYSIETLLPRLREAVAMALPSERDWMLEGGNPGSLRFRYPTIQRGQIGCGPSSARRALRGG